MSFPVTNDTPLAVDSYADTDEHGVPQRWLIVKATFRLSTGRLAARQLPVYRTAQTHALGDLALEAAQRRAIASRQGQPWVRHEVDLQPLKPHFDVIVHAWAQMPDGRPRTHFDAQVEAFGRVVKLRGHAPRHWRRALGLLGPRVPRVDAPVRRVPLLYPFAFGGEATIGRGRHRRTEAWEPNQEGMGYCLSARAAPHTPLPWVEAAAHPMRHWRDRPQVLALGVMGAHDQPRLGWQGTRDDAWQCGRAPRAPLDHHPRCRNAAAVPLQFAQTPAPGQQVRLHHLGARAVQAVSLPLLHLEVGARTSVGRCLPVQAAHWDTLIIEPDENHYAIVWRAALRDTDPSGPITRLRLRARTQAPSPGAPAHAHGSPAAASMEALLG